MDISRKVAISRQQCYFKWHYKGLNYLEMDFPRVYNRSTTLMVILKDLGRIHVIHNTSAVYKAYNVWFSYKFRHSATELQIYNKQIKDFSI